MHQELVASFPYTKCKKYEKLQSRQVSFSDLEKEKEAINESIESKIKIAILNLRLWIITAVIVFLVTTGSGLMCMMRTAGKVEEKVDTIQTSQMTFGKQLEQLRQEIWQKIPIGFYRQQQGVNNDQQTQKVPAENNGNVARF